MLLQHPYQSDPLPHLCTLTGLRELDINHVSVTTGIYSVTRLSSLTSLALNGCAVQTLPAAIWTLPQLQVDFLECAGKGSVAVGAAEPKRGVLPLLNRAGC
mgnify:CR=1 FL=1